MPASASQPASCSAILCGYCLFEPTGFICLFDFLSPLPLSALTFPHHKTFKAFLLFPIWSSPTCRFCRDNALFSRRSLCELSSQTKAATPPGSLSPGMQTQFLLFSHLANYLSSINPSFCLSACLSICPSLPSTQCTPKPLQRVLITIISPPLSPTLNSLPTTPLVCQTAC